MNNDPDVVLASDEERKAYFDRLRKILKDGVTRTSRTPEQVEARKSVLKHIAWRMAADAGHDPNMPTQIWPPYRVATPWGEVFRVNPDATAPLWERYLGAAEAALSAVEEATE